MTSRDDYKFLTADTKRLLDGQEGRYVDFKAKPDGVKAEDFVALANARGGTILIGVDEPADKKSKQGKDIFSEGFTIFPDHLEVVDFNHERYNITLSDGQISLQQNGG
jgi:predicted HTH transcriptional regulator